MHLLHVLACFKDLHVLAYLAALAHDVTSCRPKAKTYRRCHLNDEILVDLDIVGIYIVI